MRRILGVEIISNNSVPDFTINYGSIKINVNRYCLGIYSAKFRKIPNIFEINSYDVVDNSISSKVFNDFMYAAQGKKFSLSDDTLLDFVYLSSIWEADSVLNVAKSYFNKNPNIEKAIKKRLETKEEFFAKILNDMIASNLDKAFEHELFTKIPHQIMFQILNSKEFKINNIQLLHSFLINCLKEHRMYGYDLYKFIDVKRLTPEDASDIFSQSHLLKYISANKQARSSEKLYTSIDEVKHKVKKMKKSMTKLEKIGLSNKFEDIHTQFRNADQYITEKSREKRLLNKKQLDPEAEFHLKFEEFAGRFVRVIIALEDRIHKSFKSNRISLEDLKFKSETLESYFTSFYAESREMRRKLGLIRAYHHLILEKAGKAKRLNEGESGSTIETSTYLSDSTLSYRNSGQFSEYDAYDPYDASSDKEYSGFEEDNLDANSKDDLEDDVFVETKDPSRDSSSSSGSRR